MSSYKVLVTGATGFVGQHLCRYLLENGFSVRAVGRKPSIDINHSRLTYCSVPTINGSTDWSDMLQDVHYVVHLAARVHQMKDKGMQALKAYQETNVRGTQQLATAAIKHDVKRFIYISTIKVLGEKTIEMPLRAEEQPHARDAYSLSKLKAELIVQEKSRRSGMEWVIVRPPLVYGPGVKGNFARIFKLAKSRMPLPFAGIGNRRSLVSVYNLVSFITCCLTHPNANREVFLVSDNQDLSTGDLVRTLRRLQGRWSLLFPLPKNVLRGLGFCFGMRNQVSRLVDSLQINMEKSMRLLNWTPPLSVSETLRMMLEEEKSEQEVESLNHPPSKQVAPSL